MGPRPYFCQYQFAKKCSCRNIIFSPQNAQSYIIHRGYLQGSAIRVSDDAVANSCTPAMLCVTSLITIMVPELYSMNVARSSHLVVTHPHSALERVGLEGILDKVNPSGGEPRRPRPSKGASPEKSASLSHHSMLLKPGRRVACAILHIGDAGHQSKPPDGPAKW